MQTIQRPEYLEWLKRWQDKQIIKVVSGVRRCGKSTLFELYKEYLQRSGVSPQQIHTVNFEDVDFEDLTDYRELYRYLKVRLVPDRMNYIFLDEIQHCQDYQKAVDSLFVKSNCDVYLTGSNAYFMSGDLATVLSGRYVELKMLPLSFKEYRDGLDASKQSLSKREQFDLYLEYGSFPFIVKYNNFGRDARDYLTSLYDTILNNDIAKRKRIADTTSLDNVTRFLLHNIGNKASSTKIADTLKSARKSVDQKTVDKYIEGLTESLLLYEARRYNIKGRQFLTTQSKYYAVDMGIRNVKVKGKDTDIGHMLENIVYLELKRRGYDVYVGEVDDREMDFVAVQDDCLTYYQVAASTLDEKTLARELAPFNKIRDHYPKYLLTLDDVFANANYNGIQKKNAIDWLLEK